jgi:hypothetical protein
MMCIAQHYYYCNCIAKLDLKCITMGRALKYTLGLSYWVHDPIAVPRLRPLFKQIVEGSDDCGLFVDNFLKIVLFCVF